MRFLDVIDKDKAIYPGVSELFGLLCKQFKLIWYFILFLNCSYSRDINVIACQNKTTILSRLHESICTNLHVLLRFSENSWKCIKNLVRCRRLRSSRGTNAIDYVQHYHPSGSNLMMCPFGVQRLSGVNDIKIICH